MPPTTTLAPKLVEQVLDTPEKVVEAIQEVEKDDPVQVAHVLSSESIDDVPIDEVKQFIEEIDFDSFTEDESAQVMEALSNAPAEVKAVFEEEVNIFDNENFNDYVPTGSNINVEQRRVLVAAGAAMTAIGASVQGAGGSAGGGGSKGGRKTK